MIAQCQCSRHTGATAAVVDKRGEDDMIVKAGKG